MGGEPWPDLQQKIEKGEVKGAWPAARDHWGAFSSKLETVLLVAVPSAANRNPARILPGRDDVYIIPRADCTPGNEGDPNVYYSCKNIKACLVLKPPANAEELVPPLAITSRVLCTTDYDKKGMSNMRVSAVDGNKTVPDIDRGERFAPKITQFTMAIAQPTSPEGAVTAAHHSTLQPTFSSQQLWLEDVARFKPAEMSAGILGVEQLLTRAYTMAYLYTTVENATEICRHGIPTDTGSGRHRLTLCLLPPSDKILGWQPNAGGGFQRRVAELLGMDERDVQAVVLLGVPTCCINKARQMPTANAIFTLVEPVDECTFLQSTEDGGAVYSCAHVAKVWTLEATALSDARQALINVRAGRTLMDAFAGKTEEQIQRDIQTMLRDSASSIEEGEPPVGEELLQQQIAAHAAKMAEVRARARAIEAEEAEMEVKMAALQAQLTC